MLPPYSNHTPQTPHFVSTASYPSTSQSKTSLNFILSPPDVPLNSTPSSSYQTSNNTSTPTSPSPHTLSRLEALPRTLLSQIAYHLILTSSSARTTPHPSAILPLLLTSTSLNSSLNITSNPLLYNTLFRATFDHAALTRRYEWMKEHLSDVAGRGKKMFDLFGDPKSWAEDYRGRWDLARRMKREVSGMGRGGQRNGNGDKTGDGQEQGVNEDDDEERVNQDLWRCWFLLTENDGKNLPFLTEECNFQAWIVSHYRQNMLKDSLVPGYPKETGGKALATWCALLSGTGCTTHEADVTIRSKAMPYKRFGFTWRRAPPHFILGCYLLFLRLLERQPKRDGRRSSSSSFAALSNRSDPEYENGLFSKTKILHSPYHDREWQRNSVCQDPHTSPGLPALTFRGDVEGFWRAKFLFYDFEMYRSILAGDMRTVYTGMFAEQVAELELKETVIRVRNEEVGGKGPLLCAGFEEGVGDDGDIVGGDEEQGRIESGYGCEVLDKGRERERDEEGWTKEILISGKCRTSWGLARVRGRVRSWDGLIILALSYSRHIMGKWLWRGYIHTGGNLIGRWRDTFTPEHLRGHEGAFGMVRAGDPFWPEGYPMQMEGVGGIPNQTQQALPAQAQSQVQAQQALSNGGTGGMPGLSAVGNGVIGPGERVGIVGSRGLAAAGSPETQVDRISQVYGQAGPVRDDEDESMRGSSSSSRVSNGSRGMKRDREEE